MSQLNENFVWNIADLLRGPFKPHQYGTVILPFTILRRLESVMEPHRKAMAAALTRTKDPSLQVTYVERATGLAFFNTSQWTLVKALEDPDNLAVNLTEYVSSFSESVDVFRYYNFAKTIDDLDAAGRLVKVTDEFAKIDMSLEAVSNAEMGDLFEHLIYKDFESANAEAGDFYTPRDAVRLLVDLVLAEDSEALTEPGISRSVYDPAAGTGGMLSVAEDHLLQRNPKASLALYAQEINPASYAICKSDMLIKGQNVANVKLGDTLADDKFEEETFDFVLSNPPFGIDWKASEEAVRAEAKRGGRFAPGLPPVSDGAMLFLLHVASKIRPVDKRGQGGRAGIVLNGSPLFNGGADSGPSNIRGHLLENDLLDAIVALPTDMFYNTGIATYLWILDNAKPEERQGKVQLIDATNMGTKMRKSLGAKRIEINSDNSDEIVRAYAVFDEHPDDADVRSKIFDTLDFAYWQATIERPLRLNFTVTEDRLESVKTSKPLTKIDGLHDALQRFGHGLYKNRGDFRKALGLHLRSNGITPTAPQWKALLTALGEQDETADICVDAKGNPEPDTTLRDTEIIPFGWNGLPKNHAAMDDTVTVYFETEVKPYVPDAWVDTTKTKVGYEIPFTRHFYQYVPPRPLAEIDVDLNAAITTATTMLQEIEG